MVEFYGDCHPLRQTLRIPAVSVKSNNFYSVQVSFSCKYLSLESKKQKTQFGINTSLLYGNFRSYGAYF